ncbi:MAG: glycosyltransferase, partial [Deltaproteobacteria bacterium]|nr:glycosyltransferase [Deltaproteobacteria bacterium]
FTDFELILSDNASTDRTGEIALAYAARDSRIRYYRSDQNMGAGWNVRRVYELATGRYFKQAAADDLLEPDFLWRCVEILEKDPGCVLAYTRTKEVNESGNFIRNYVTPMQADATDPVARFRAILLPLHNCYQVFGVMRMSALQRIPAQGSYVNADGVLLARMSLLGRFYEVPEHLFISRRHSGQSMQMPPVRLQQRRFRLTDKWPTLPPPEWWDPTKTRALTFPEFRQLREYVLSVYRAPLGPAQRIRCYGLLLHWVKIHYRRMMKDLLIALDQILYKLQVARTGPIKLPQKARPG